MSGQAGRRRAARWLWVAVVVGLEIWLWRGRGWVLLAGLVCMLVAAWVYARLWTVHRLPAGVVWRALASFERRQLDDASRFPNLRLGAARPSRWRADKVVGTLMVDAKGLLWLPRRGPIWGTKVSGRVRVTWSDLVDVRVARAPGKIPGLGGLVVIETEDQPALSGEFLGSGPALRRVLTSKARTQ
jgi:hypothetical protein